MLARFELETKGVQGTVCWVIILRPGEIATKRPDCLRSGVMSKDEMHCCCIGDKLLWEVVCGSKWRDKWRTIRWRLGV